MKAVVLVDDIDRAPIGQPVDRELCHGHQVGVVIERRRQDGAGFGKKRELLGVGFRFRPRHSLINEQLVALFLGSRSS